MNANREAVAAEELALTQRYQVLWDEARSALLQGEPQFDSLLQRGSADDRRGLTLLLRPDAATAHSVAALQAELAEIEPAQYFYRSEQLHVTVLSLFTATPAFGPYFARLPRYLDILDRTLAAVAPFTLRFRGVSASPSAVMVAGYPANATLAGLRDRLRAGLAAAGLGDDLDRRYHLTTAHMTMLRLRAPLHDAPAFVAAIERRRARDVGTTVVAELLLVENDWYMTPGVVKVLRRYPLTSSQPT